MTLDAGTKLGRYEIRSKIGEGGMGEVYLARDTSELERTVAIKLLPSEVASDPKRMQRFIQEARTVSALNHPNILTVHEFGQDDAMRFIVTEYVEGVTLREHMRAHRMKLHDVLDIATQTAAALDAAHEAHVVHRDMKPDNIMVRRRDGIVKVLDFGLAKPVERILPKESGTDLEAGTKLMVHTEPGVLMGTVSYMSPEQSEGSTVVDHRTDIWSLGAVLYEMVAGRVPFEAKDVHRQIIAIQEQDLVPVSRFTEGVPERLEDIVAKALAKDRNERYQTAKDLLIDLRNLKRKLEVDAEIDRTTPELRPVAATGSEIATASRSAPTAQATAPTTVSSAEYIVSGIRKHKLVAAAALLVLVTGAGIGLYLWAHKPATIRSVAVMPFVSETSNQDVEYLSDGMTETLISSLSQLPNLNIKARSSVFRYKGKETDPQTIAKELNVQAVLNGRISQHGDQLTLTLELVDVQTENVIWSEQYNRRQADLVSLQSEIARDVLRKLKTKLSGADETKVTKTYTADSNAYQLYLKGRFYFNKRTKDDLLRSIEFYKQAIGLDSNFALAYVGIADSYAIMSPYGYAAPNEIFPKAKVAAQRAIEIDPDLAEAHAAYAKILADYDWNWSEAEREYKRSIELNPNIPLTHYLYGASCLTPVGRFDEGIRELKRALELDPLSVPAAANLANCLTYARKHDLAVRQGIEALRLEPNHPTARVALGFAYAASGMYDQAISICDTTLRADPGNQDCLQVVGLAYAKARRRQESDAVLRKFEELGKTGYSSSYRTAAIYALLGDKDKAFAWLEKALAAHDWDIGRINVDPFLDSLHDDPRFKDLIKRMGFSARQ
jgi:eukaryotic-like serine/threonine-protein kinase